MDMQEIAPEQWQEFLAGFSRAHAGWPVEVEVQDTGGPRKLVEWQPLQGLSLDTKGTRPASISISVAGDDGPHLSHSIPMPLHIRASSTDVEIEPAQGPATIMHFRSPKV